MDDNITLEADIVRDKETLTDKLVYQLTVFMAGGIIGMVVRILT